MMWYPHFMGPFGPAFMFLPLAVLIALAVVAVALVVRGSGSEQWTGTQHGSSRDSAARILADRYARGEIDDDEYRRRLHNLQPPTSER
jgi:putative membrane protein